MNQAKQDIDVSFEQLVQACDNQRHWVLSLIEENVIDVSEPAQKAHYNGFHLAVVRRSWRIHRDFDASAAATALILDLLTELDDLRRRP
ncbi:chaperone modulator CbpM [Neisseriaceae bacterium ESL0693]|nr:chaperone modulator CbpM [Neisseriaceae bacterium ESL0693]